MGKTAIVYYSQHHGNTKKVLDAIAGYDKDVFFIATAGNPIEHNFNSIVAATKEKHCNEIGRYQCGEFIYMRQQIYEAADLFYIRKDRRRWFREDPLGVDQRDMCYEKKCCVGVKNYLLFLMVLSYGTNFKRSLMICEKIVTRFMIWTF